MFVFLDFCGQDDFGHSSQHSLPPATGAAFERFSLAVSIHPDLDDADGLPELFGHIDLGHTTANDASCAVARRQMAFLYHGGHWLRALMVPLGN